MITEAAVLDALKGVRDPELRQSIVDLHMVRGVAVKGDRVRVDVALTVAGCPLHEQIRADVVREVGRLEGVRAVDVTLSVMDEAERKAAFRAAFGRSEATPSPVAPRPAAGAAADRGKERAIPVLTLDPATPPLMRPNTATKLIGVASGKGGVGKSTVAANLAVAMARTGRRVGLMDIDVYGFSQGRILGAKGQPEVTPDQKVVPWRVHGIQLVSMGMFVPEDQAIIWRGPMLGKMMQQFFTDVAWDDLDYLFLDLPPGTGDLALDVGQKLPHAKLVLVTTPQPVAMHVATRTANVAQKLEQQVVGVIENMSYLRCPHGERMDVFGRGGGEMLARALGVPLLGQIPLEPALREAADTGRPIVVRDPDSESARAFLAIAERLLDVV
ncbi:MAG: Mrp/NBP35 family ATP-binding protein [Actinomycetia bacterium]|nr:Mrp/NBP35 family ATP-binding protein [Actinomycetes bacterium]